MEGTVTISKSKYVNLLVSQARLNRLETGGVGNWEWYSESLNPDGEPDMDKLEEEIKEQVKGM